MSIIVIKVVTKSNDPFRETEVPRGGEPPAEAAGGGLEPDKNFLVHPAKYLGFD
jgi:hypothetical protein